MANHNISYEPLLKTLNNWKLKKTDLGKNVGLFKATTAKSGRDEKITLGIIGRICVELCYSISDVVEVVLQDPV